MWSGSIDVSRLTFELTGGSRKKIAEGNRNGTALKWTAFKDYFDDFDPRSSKFSIPQDYNDIILMLPQMVYLLFNLILQRAVGHNGVKKVICYFDNSYKARQTVSGRKIRCFLLAVNLRSINKYLVIKFSLRCRYWAGSLLSCHCMINPLRTN